MVVAGSITKPTALLLIVTTFAFGCATTTGEMQADARKTYAIPADVPAAALQSTIDRCKSEGDEAGKGLMIAGTVFAIGGLIAWPLAIVGLGLIAGASAKNSNAKDACMTAAGYPKKDDAPAPTEVGGANSTINPVAAGSSPAVVPPSAVVSRSAVVSPSQAPVPVPQPPTKIDWQPPTKINCPRTSVWTGYGCSSSKLGFDIGPDFRVINIEKGGPAEQAGVLDGDVLIAIDDTRAQPIGLIHTLFLRKKAGDKVKLTLDRRGSLFTVEPQFVPRAVAAQDTRSILWTTTTFSGDADKRPVWWQTGRVFPTEKECRTEGGAQVRAYQIDHPVDARLSRWNLRIVDDALVVNLETFQKVGITVLEPGQPVFAVSCWPVGVNPR
jgi:hypothetical protein